MINVHGKFKSVAILVSMTKMLFCQVLAQSFVGKQSLLSKGAEIVSV